MGRLGVDLSGDSVILASVSPTASRLQLRDFERLESNPDLYQLAQDLRRARRQHGFPRRAEVVAWPGDPRTGAVRQAGFIVERVVSPGEALERVARMHHGLTAVPGVTAVLSVDPSGGALAVVRDGSVLQETALTWSSRGASDAADSDLLRRYSFLSELTETMAAAFTSVLRGQNARVHEILTCGSLPDLRSLTMPLADEFDVEVETLDSLSEIDVRVKGRMPEEIADAVPTLWLAMVASRRWHPKRHRPVRKILKVGVPVGLAAGFALLMLAGGREQGSAGSTGSKPAVPQRTPVKTAQTSARATAPAARPSQAAPVPSAQASAPVHVPPVQMLQPAPLTQVQAPQPAPVPPVQTPPMATRQVETPAAPARMPPSTATRAESPMPPTSGRAAPRRIPPPVQTVPVLPPRTETVRAVPEPAEPPRPITPQPRMTDRQTEAAPVEVPARPASNVPSRSNRSNRSNQPGRSNASSQFSELNLSNLPRVSLPLTSILWSPERQLVVADGETLEVGDTIGGMKIVRIEEDSVIVRDKAGRLRRAALRRPPPETMP